jgi:hypothetical protein
VERFGIAIVVGCAAVIAVLLALWLVCLVIYVFQTRKDIS